MTLDHDEEYLPSDELNLPYVAFATVPRGTTSPELLGHPSTKQIAADGDQKRLVAGHDRHSHQPHRDHRQALDMVEKNVRYAEGPSRRRLRSCTAAEACCRRSTATARTKRRCWWPCCDGRPSAHVARSTRLRIRRHAGLPGVDHFNHAIVVVDAPRGSCAVDRSHRRIRRAGQIAPKDQGRYGADRRRFDGGAHAHTRATSEANRAIRTRMRHAAGRRKGAHHRMPRERGRGRLSRRVCAISPKKTTARRWRRPRPPTTSREDGQSRDGEPDDFTAVRVTLQLSEPSETGCSRLSGSKSPTW